MSKLIKALKKDFMEQLMDHEEMSKKEAKKVWEAEMDTYLNCVFQHMSDEIVYSLESYSKEMVENK